MNRNDFLRMVETSGPVDRQMIGEVSDLINIFPYFQSAYLLLLKGLKNTGDVKFENQLRVSAIHIADREVLYYLLMKEPQVNIEHVLSPILPVTSDITPEESQQAIIETTKSNEDLTVNVEQEMNSKLPEPSEISPEGSQPTVIETAKSSEDMTVKAEQEPNSKLPEPSEIAPEESQQVVIETAKNSEDLINEIEKSSEDGNKEDQAENKEQNGRHSILITSEIDNEESSSMVFVIDEESGSVEEKIIYMDPGFSVPERFDLLELDTENKTPEPEEDHGKKEQPDSIGISPEKQRQADLIDKFILNNPRIETVKEKFDAPIEDISKPFVEEQGGFLTETLARIYIKQGYYSKAINVYEKLCLKFPEKCSYFAAQIEKVNDLIKT